ncbi:hypothetical protein Tco_0164397 [Tanacetum coccineum]
MQDGGPSQGLYLCRIVLRYRCVRTELITPDLACPLTHQLLQNSGGDSGPDLSFDKSAYPERLFSLAHRALGNLCPYDLTKPLPVQMSSQGRQIIPVDFFFNNDLQYLRGGSNDKKYTAFTTKSKAARPAYTTFSNPQVMIFEDKLKQKRFMCANELHKFSDGTLNSVCDTLDQMLHELHLGYNTAMKRRLWTRLDQQMTRIMIKAINQKLLDRRIMRSLEKFVGGRDYGEDRRLLQRTI